MPSGKRKNWLPSEHIILIWRWEEERRSMTWDGPLYWDAISLSMIFVVFLGLNGFSSREPDSHSLEARFARREPADRLDSALKRDEWLGDSKRFPPTVINLDFVPRPFDLDEDGGAVLAHPSSFDLCPNFSCACVTLIWVSGEATLAGSISIPICKYVAASLNSWNRMSAEKFSSKNWA
jgi:hypothetical protein